jgi:hypothetical protein
MLGGMENTMRESGLKASSMEKESSHYRMGRFSMESGLREGRMGWVCASTLMGQSIPGLG